MAIKIQSNLYLVNDSTPREDGWYEWSVWVAGSKDELAAVDSVTYRLHPTFPKPVITVKDPSKGFRLDSSGWGEFAIHATAVIKDGRKILLERWLTLDREAPSRAATVKEQARPSVFISHGMVDAALVEQLTKELSEQGIDVSTEKQLSSGDDWSRAVHQQINAADLVLAVFSNPPNPYVEDEAEKAFNSGKLLPIIVGKPTLPKPVEQITRLVVDEQPNVAGLANSIAARVKDHMTRQNNSIATTREGES